MGVPKVGYPWAGVPLPARSDRGYLRWGTPHRGTPQPGLTGGTRGGVLPLTGVPLLAGPGWGTPLRGVDRQTPVKTVPYRHTTYAVGNYVSTTNGFVPWGRFLHSEQITRHVELSLKTNGFDVYIYNFLTEIDVQNILNLYN